MPMRFISLLMCISLLQPANCAMMGLQATTNAAAAAGAKRKLDAPASLTTPADATSRPAKSGRWEADDCIARLQAVAMVPTTADAWRAPTPALTATLLSDAADDEFDEDDFDDELSDEEKCGEPVRFTQQPSYNRYVTVCT